MDERFETILKRRDLDPLFFIDVFNKCNSYTRLFGDEYHIGKTLHEFGLMSIKRVPIFNKENLYIGVKVYFKSMFLNGK